jgi:small subunit ribosomal protein S20
MPQIKSAAKRLRQNVRRQERNRAVRSQLKTGIRAFFHQLEKGEPEAARRALDQVYSLLDRALIKGVVKRNYVSRQKSRLAQKLPASPAPE